MSEFRGDSTEWQSKANCLNKDPQIFDDQVEGENRNTREARLRMARTICQLCVVNEACLSDALQKPRDYEGVVRGGYTTRQRNKIARATA